MATEALPTTVVLGLGRSGIGAARLLRSQGHGVLIVESRDNGDLRAQAEGLASEGIDVLLAAPLTPETFGGLPRPERVVVSPGIRWDHPLLLAWRRQGIQVEGELSSTWRTTAGTPWIGITGTNGKTTVTHLVHHLLSEAGLDAPLCGNVGISAAELALQRQAPGAKAPDWLVVEVSSYQIEAAPELAPAIGVWTTLTPDHLERHGTIEAYRAIKRSLIERSQRRILNADDPDLRSQAPSWDRVDWVTAGCASDLPAGMDPLLSIADGLVQGRSGPLFAADCLAMPGAHNRQNMLLATAVGLHAGLTPGQMEAALRCFAGVPHRLERLRQLGQVTWYNDSKATNYDAAEVALKALAGPLVVLAGGQSKQGDSKGWLAQLRQQAAAVVVYGAAAAEFEALLRQDSYPGQLHRVEGLEQAVPLAAGLAKAIGITNVLLSPACASFDQYSDFEARGDHFRALVAAL
jgi:UDP-N-acetylmuramoylalanine--D-glutamate ligase